jgi:hypothetical protein
MIWPISLIWRSGRDRQAPQWCESLDRVTAMGAQDRAFAKAKNDAAARGAIRAFERGLQESAPLRKVLSKVIDPQRDGRFAPSNEPERRS